MFENKIAIKDILADIQGILIMVYMLRYQENMINFQVGYWPCAYVGVYPIQEMHADLYIGKNIINV